VAESNGEGEMGMDEYFGWVNGEEQGEQPVNMGMETGQGEKEDMEMEMGEAGEEDMEMERREAEEEELFCLEVEKLIDGKYFSRMEVGMAIRMFSAPIRLCEPTEVNENGKRKICYKGRGGTNLVLVCADENCLFHVHASKATKTEKGYLPSILWKVKSKKRAGPNNYRHSNRCAQPGDIQPRVAAEMPQMKAFLAIKNGKHTRGTKAEGVLDMALSMGMHVGGSSDGGLAPMQSQGAYRVAAAYERKAGIAVEKNACKLPGYFKLLKTRNPELLCGYSTTPDNTLSRIYLINPMGPVIWASGYIRKCVAIDGAFWKQGYREVKLLIVMATTGDGKNIMLLWSVVEGETIVCTEFVIGLMRKAGMELNKVEVVIITDQGKALHGGIIKQAPLASRQLCAKHWEGNNIKGNCAAIWQIMKGATNAVSHADAMETLRKTKPSAYEKINKVTLPEANEPMLPQLLQHIPRRDMQADGRFGPNFGKVASFAEQGMSETVQDRLLPPFLALIRRVSKMSQYNGKFKNLVRKLMEADAKASMGDKRMTLFDISLAL
jgi:hypothetical protein